MTTKVSSQVAGLGLVAVLAALAPTPPVAEVGRAYEVPYRLTDTNHVLVRVRINGKGPFNFLVDTGAPALFVSTETAAKVGLKPAGGAFWTPVDRLDFEGGATLAGLKARVEDPFQLVGMNALGLPGASIDGILGYTVLARFRLVLDLSRDRMTWTRLAFEPPDPPAPADAGGAAKPPSGVQAMNALGPLAKVAAALIGRQAEDEVSPRGYFGLELAEPPAGSGGVGVLVAGVLAGSPAASAGVAVGDTVLKIGGAEVRGPAGARAAVAGVRAGESVRLTVRRAGGGAEVELTVQTGEGL